MIKIKFYRKERQNVSLKKTKYSTKYASIFSRILANVIDGIIFGYLTFLLLHLLEVSVNKFISSDLILSYQWQYQLIAMLIISLIPCYFLAIHKWQATIGKRILGIHVVDISGMKISFKQAFIRNGMIVIILLLCMYTGGDITSESRVNLEFEKFVIEKMPNLYSSARQEQMSVDSYMLTEKGAIQLNESLSKLELSEKERFYALPKNEKIITSMSFSSDESAFQNLRTLLFIIWFLLISVTKENLTIHDMIAKTRVLKGRI